MASTITSNYILSDDELSHSIKVFAGPGAGKTYLLVKNIKHIISSNELITSGNARKVLCITYTNSAVDEIKHRLEQYTDYVETYTIHGFIIEHIIKPFQEYLIEIIKKDFGIEVSNKGAISSQVEGLGILHGVDKEDIFRFIREYGQENFKDDNFDYSKLSMGNVEVDNMNLVNSIVTNTKYNARFIYPSKIKEDHIIPLKTYIWSIVRKLTHNEILYFGYRILQSNPTALYAIRVKFPYIFVDEFQDTNPLQTLLLKKIGEKSTKINIVGDIAQSIYSFQGAKPSDFLAFKIDDENDLEYSIEDNRRSTNNIVNFCNFLRQSDNTVIQKSIKSYKNDTEKEKSESNAIHFLIGDTANIKSTINQVISDGGVVLTRTWAAAFNYIQDISDEQAKILKSIYNSYYNTPIQIRDEIIQHNNVTWVRAFRFVFNLWESYNKGSFIDIIRAFNLYTKIDYSALTPEIIFQIDSLAKDVFSEVCDDNLACEIIKKFNERIKKSCYLELVKILGDENFQIHIFDENERDALIESVNQVHWSTAYKLFTEVFSEDSKYMTVHQAKGLEWDKVVVALVPSQKNDQTSIENVFLSPELINETPANEFVRMYYVACSRAIKELYVHIPSGCSKGTISNSLKQYIENTKINILYDFLES